MQPLRITEMTLNSRNSVFIPIHHSFGFPDVVQEGGQLTPLDPPP